MSAETTIGPGQMTARGIMSVPAITVVSTTTAADVALLLTERHISGVVVVDDDGGVVGLVSEYDLLAKEGATAGEVMTTAVVSVSADCPVEDVRHLLVERRVRRLPVMDHGRLAGVVSRGDVLATLALEWVCSVCGQPVRGFSPPQSCPTCQGASDLFTLEEQPPGH